MNALSSTTHFALLDDFLSEIICDFEKKPRILP